MRAIQIVASLSVFVFAWGCSSDDTTPGSGQGGSGGGAGATTGGVSSGGSGGAATGGSSSGGSSNAGSSNAGSSSGGSAGAASGGSAAGGTAGAGASAGQAGSGGGGAIAPLNGMNFFVTSRSPGEGGNLGSLDDADAFCAELALAVSGDLGAKTWRAYLSTAAADARDRIGAGPWRNQAGVVVANNLAELHQQEDGEALDATWPPTDLGIALDETGAELPNDVHDILTGTNADGTLAAGATCNDWTSASTTDTAQVGHSNRDGGGRPPYFNATHTVGCAPSATNRTQGTVTSGGGRGSFYCFALEPSPAP